jgi:protein-S-isoprenylcysteine O-methyltransferase Ste14
MTLIEQYEKSGNWLFKRRGYLPVALVVLFLAALHNYRYPYGNETTDRLWEILCLTVSLIGLGIRIIAVGYAPKGTSGRNTSKQVADTLNTTGMYSVVRHPLYFGNYLAWLGISMFFMKWWVVVIVTLVFWVYYERIMFAEEAFLHRKFGDEFVRWAETTPAFIPDVRKWTPSDGRFSVTTVLKREQTGLLAILASFMFLEVAGDFEQTGRLCFDPMWSWIFATGLAIFLVLTGLKKTKLI